MGIETSIKAEISTVGDALRWSQSCFEEADLYFGHGTDNAWDEALHLVLGSLKLPMESDPSVLDCELSEAEKDRLIANLRERLDERVPVPYITGRAWFAGLEFKIDRRALIPRSPIAELIERDFAPWYGGARMRRVLDLCCGGGCIGLAVAAWNPDVQVDLVDLDANALALAEENRALLSLESRVDILQSDLFEQLRGRQYDLLVTNPPYVDADDLAQMPREYLHEPSLALGAGADGLAVVRRILDSAVHFLAPDGLLVGEVGNSWQALEASYPGLPFTWIELERGGHGVFVLTARELAEHHTARV
ncbi:MAG: 50S ribosomal protein L3 N(5)-glutamine methyltransferase [Halieaceae bacterium]|jgi:ribosomal protein L3 glutamine methyltransferase|nr:50S ribosomal protein L3 N(5)-glutamine methyltransferase [Halieaceae bacterium]